MRIHVRITGRVQGVGYRAWAVRTACGLNLSGFVRNRHDRSVEVVAEGAEVDVNTFLECCHKGPLWGRVDAVTPVSIPDAFTPPITDGIFQAEPTV